MTGAAPNPASGPRVPAVLRGIVGAAFGKAAALRQFGDTPQAVLAALAPLLAFLLVGVALTLLSPVPGALRMLAELTVGLLGALVVSFELARWWGRTAAWAHYAVAYCWCQWTAPLAMVGMLLVMAVLMSLGLDGHTARQVGALATFGYAVWLHWFLARHALGLTALRALTLVVTVSLATAAMMIVPELLA